jgi:hypothetical protein
MPALRHLEKAVDNTQHVRVQERVNNELPGDPHLASATPSRNVRLKTNKF